MNIPPQLRQLQQSWLVQTIIIPMLIAFGGASIASLVTVSRGNLFNLTMTQLYDALGLGGFAALAYIAAIFQHSPGSATFHADGTENKLVEKVATYTQALPGSYADRLEVKVIPKVQMVTK